MALILIKQKIQKENRLRMAQLNMAHRMNKEIA
jgi:hypothetical protein